MSKNRRRVVTAVLESGEELTAEKMLVSIGRRYNTDRDRFRKGWRSHRRAGKIVVDARMQTNVPGIHAVGDVASRVPVGTRRIGRGKDCQHKTLLVTLSRWIIR